jgi:hypothetical protein
MAQQQAIRFDNVLWSFDMFCFHCHYKAASTSSWTSNIAATHSLGQLGTTRLEKVD